VRLVTNRGELVGIAVLGNLVVVNFIRSYSRDSHDAKDRSSARLKEMRWKRYRMSFSYYSLLHSACWHKFGK